MECAGGSGIFVTGDDGAPLPTDGVDPTWDGYRVHAWEYEFEHYYFRDMDRLGCVYVFASLEDRGYWFPYYIGKTSNTKGRLLWPDNKPSPRHRTWRMAAELGATHVHTSDISDADEIDRVEHWLIYRYQPVLNVRRRTYG